MHRHLRTLLSTPSNLLPPALPRGHRLHRLLDKSMDRVTISRRSAFPAPFHWGPERYGLERSRMFRGLAPDEQEKILVLLSDWNLNLACAIETSGHNYGAKMILLSETAEEKSLYSLFVAEEAIHRREFLNFMERPLLLDISLHPMLPPLSDAIQHGTRETLLFVVQIVLEGFGLSHYADLRSRCLTPDLQGVLGRILQDEARHHGAGLLLFDPSDLSEESREQIFHFTREFVQALQGAGWVFPALEAVRGPLSRAERSELARETRIEEQAFARLQKLKRLIAPMDRMGLLKRLDRDRAFVPA